MQHLLVEFVSLKQQTISPSSRCSSVSGVVVSFPVNPWRFGRGYFLAVDLQAPHQSCSEMTAFISCSSFKLSAKSQIKPLAVALSMFSLPAVVQAALTSAEDAQHEWFETHAKGHFGSSCCNTGSSP